MVKCLSKEEISEKMKTVDAAWFFVENSISKEFLFKDFVHAFQFMTSVAVIAEKLNHHPNWSNVYNKVFIALTTHEAGGITELDFSFAKEVDQITTC